MRTLAGIMLVCVVCCAGCGGSDKAKLYSVTGKVTVGGKPLTGANILFTNVNAAKGAQAGYSAALGPGGEYELIDGVDGSKGAAVGKYKVSFTKTQSMDDARKAMMAPPTGGAPPAAAAGDAPFPKEYSSFETSPKEVEVKAESNKIDITI